MSSIRIHATDRQGHSHSLDVQEIYSLMEQLKARGLPVAATCGGSKSCATCHVYVAEGYARVGEPDEDEVDLLIESDHYRPGISRLSCQITLDCALNELKVELAPQD